MTIVFNLTDRHIDYRRKTIPPFGSLSYDLDFIPDRDLALQKAGVLAFGALPPGWVRPVAPQVPEKVVKVHAPVQPAKAVQVEAVQVSGSSTEQKFERDDNRKNRK